MRLTWPPVKVSLTTLLYNTGSELHVSKSPQASRAARLLPQRKALLCHTWFYPTGREAMASLSNICSASTCIYQVTYILLSVLNKRHHNMRVNYMLPLSWTCTSFLSAHTGPPCSAHGAHSGPLQVWALPRRRRTETVERFLV